MPKNIVGFKVKKNNSQKGKKMLDLISSDLETLGVAVLVFLIAMGIVSNWANENK